MSTPTHIYRIIFLSSIHIFCPKWSFSILWIARKFSNVFLTTFKDHSFYYTMRGKEDHPADGIIYVKDWVIFWLEARCGWEWWKRERRKRGCTKCEHKPTLKRRVSFFIEHFCLVSFFFPSFFTIHVRKEMDIYVCMCVGVLVGGWWWSWCKRASRSETTIIEVEEH